MRAFDPGANPGGSLGGFLPLDMDVRFLDCVVEPDYGIFDFACLEGLSLNLV